MHLAQFFLCLFVFTLAALANSVSESEHAQAYSLKLFSRMADYVAVQSRAGNKVPDIRAISLADLGLVSDDNTAVVRDVIGVSATNAKSSLLAIPFGDIFSLPPNSVRFISSLLDMLSRADPHFAEQFVPMLGVGSSADLGQHKNMETVARLVSTISTMEKSSLDLVTKSSGIDATSDPLVKSGSLFALSHILAMDIKRVEKAAKFFDSISRLQTSQLQAYLHDIGWEVNIIQKNAGVGEANSIPNLSYVFPISDSLLEDMAQAAREYAEGNIKHAELVRPKVKEYLREARDFLDLIPGYSTISSVVNLSSNPIVAALTDIISLTYKYPNASYWELALQYYKNIGMPGLSGLSTYPSQYAGALASSIVGGYVSDAISGIIAGILGPGIDSPTAASLHINSSPSVTVHSPVPTPAGAPPATLSNSLDSLSSKSKLPTSSAAHASPSPSSSSSSDGGFWGGLFSIFTTPNAVTSAAVLPTLPSIGPKGAVNILPNSTPQPTIAA